jgi:hypothetical protein
MVSNVTNMYAAAKTWNPFKGCEFDCTYCRPSFQQQSKRQKHLCDQCYRYEPHCHEDRLEKIPSNEIIFVCGNADISFCPPEFTRRIIDAIKTHVLRCPKKTFYFQSKRPAYFAQFLQEFPPQVILLTTLETNRDEGYRKISKAPLPSDRYQQFKSLDYPRKIVTVEPVLDFDEEVFPRWIVDLAPERVYLGLNSKPKSLTLPEPPEEKLRHLVGVLKRAHIDVRKKELRGYDFGIPR